MNEEKNHIKRSRHSQSQRDAHAFSSDSRTRITASTALSTPPSRRWHIKCNSNECDEIFNLMIRWFSSRRRRLGPKPLFNPNAENLLKRVVFVEIGYLCSIESFQIRFNYTVFFMRICVYVIIMGLFPRRTGARFGPLGNAHKKAEMKWNRDFYCEMKLLNVRKSWVLIINLGCEIALRPPVPSPARRPLGHEEFFNFPAKGVAGQIKAHSWTGKKCFACTRS